MQYRKVSKICGEGRAAGYRVIALRRTSSAIHIGRGAPLQLYAGMCGDLWLPDRAPPFAAVSVQGTGNETLTNPWMPPSNQALPPPIVKDFSAW